MRRRIPWIAAAVVLLAGLLAGCGSKNAETVVKDLNKVMEKMDSYEGSGTMILHTGQQPQTYKVEVWYQKPSYYRIALTNDKKDITQIVLRNDDGVFVLTPSLNKSYRFQSEWPENQGQVYLYQTLVKSIVLDNSRQFTSDKDSYVFDVMASNYQNGSFARQKIWLAKSDYAPRQVEITDTNANLMVEVKFDNFKFGKKFDRSAFDMQQNMTAAPNAQSGGGETNAQQPGASETKAPEASDADGGANGGTAGESSAEPGAAPSETPEGASGSESAASDGAGTDAQTEELVTVEPDPDLLPEGVEQKDIVEIKLADGSQGVMLRYTGTYDFTILESVSKTEAVTTTEGIALDLGFTMGHLTTGDTKTLTWTYDGTDYRLTTIDLPEEEMVRVAQSMVDSSGK